MGLADTLPEGPIRKFLKRGDRPLDEITLADLREEFGEEAVNRGVAYMASLSEADEKHRSASGESYVEGMERSGVNIEDEQKDKLATKWESEQQEKGIGLED